MAKKDFSTPRFVAELEVPHPERVDAALARAREAVASVPDDAMPQVSIRVDDLHNLIDHIELLKAEFRSAQRIVLEDVCATIEWFATTKATQTWQDCIELIRSNMPPGPEDEPSVSALRS
ncbi:hypothetical protein [Burkholderia seminalis]|uniref:Uncharacterized protein n=2 Tax=Burkholderia cepacia complex TaxID=87882 RepID=A0A8A8D580_9BURK|nr:hypothetical protein [Burkholderia seminalis]QTO19915.1 hypothetical protein DT99_006680 [Burkholderia seminalis]